MRKVVAELVALGVAGGIITLQVYWSFAYVTQAIKPRYHTPRLPYHYLTMVATDVLSVVAWCAVIGVLAYWDRNVVYTPRIGDPQEWLACHDAKGSDTILSYGGLSNELLIVWCEVVIDGKHRLIGNKSAIVQLHALMGLAAASLFFTGIVLAWTLLIGKMNGISPWGHGNAEQLDTENAGS
ncbi:hypothetical protein N7456_001496 [Penicillium angulare]|uniref:Uncharacterized protein n=1 Tax=Penicillium angulare TaxID=116970 RepID=A0A9W9G6K1_9EURO|nr:hypothetical protein N7456_001496 [Penicillium angulare]